MINISNHFLIAMPSISGDLYNGSVVYITEHKIENGAVGVIINKPIGKTLKNVFQGLDLADYNPDWNKNLLYIGGPVNVDNGFVLHSLTNNNNDKLFELTNNRNILSEIASSQSKDNLFVSIGYSAWSYLQLENELMRNDWLVVKADAGLIFDVEPTSRYTEAMRLLGISNLGQLYFSTNVRT